MKQRRTQQHHAHKPDKAGYAAGLEERFGVILHTPTLTQPIREG